MVRMRTNILYTPLLLIICAISACGDVSGDTAPSPVGASGLGAHAAAPAEPTKPSGTEIYAAPADPLSLCPLLSYAALTPVLGPPKERSPFESNISDRSCNQSLGPVGIVETEMDFWSNIDAANSYFDFSKENDTRIFARDHHVEDITGVGAEAYRFVHAKAEETGFSIKLVARSGNLNVTVRILASAPPGGLDARIKELSDAGATYLTSVLSTVHTAALAPSGVSPSPSASRS